MTFYDSLRVIPWREILFYLYVFLRVIKIKQKITRNYELKKLFFLVVFSFYKNHIKARNYEILLLKSRNYV